MVLQSSAAGLSCVGVETERCTCSCVQNVTLGGTGKVVGDRHPKIANNVLIGAGASVLGNIEVGTGAQVAAGSLVLKPVEPHTMVAGSPAQHVGAVIGNPAASLNQWSDDSIRLEEAKALREYSERSVMTRSGGPVCMPILVYQVLVHTWITATCLFLVQTAISLQPVAL